MREPKFWWRDAGVAARLLSPLGWAYGMVVARRLDRPGARARVPVICIGDPTVGGAGKTPTALAVARMLQDAGEQPVFLTRGYCGREPGPLRVDPAVHRAVDVGDEPLLLARQAPTIVARSRVEGAAAAVGAGASVIVMDDGFQNPSLAKDLSLLVVASERGVGNGMVTPAGPLRAPLTAQLARADALIVIGTSPNAAHVASKAQARRIPAFWARLRPDENFIASLAGRRVLAFAGIGSPEKFFATLLAGGAVLAATRAFADHHRYTRAEADALCSQTKREGLALVTTEKDLVRLRGDDETAALAAQACALPVTLAFDDEGAFRSLVFDRIATARVARTTG